MNLLRLKENAVFYEKNVKCRQGVTVVGSKPQNSPVTLATTYMVIINYVNAQFPIL